MLRLPVTEERKEFLKGEKLQCGRSRMLDVGEEVTMGDHPRDGRAIRSLQVWWSCGWKRGNSHLKQWSSSEMELPWIVHKFPFSEWKHEAAFSIMADLWVPIGGQRLVRRQGLCHLTGVNEGSQRELLIINTYVTSTVRLFVISTDIRGVFVCGYSNQHTHKTGHCLS